MFVDRTNGVLTSTYAVRQYPGQEELADDDAEIVAFREKIANPVAGVVSSGNFIRALHELEWIDAVKAAVAQASPLAQDLWVHAAHFERDHPLVLQIAEAIGKDADDLDQLFRLAATY